VAVLTGKGFFPQLISQPFHHGLVIVFTMAIVVLLIAAAASALRGGKFVHEDGTEAALPAADGVLTRAGTDIVAHDVAAAATCTDGDGDGQRVTGHATTANANTGNGRASAGQALP
jgi:hypothetical protein